MADIEVRIRNAIDRSIGQSISNIDQSASRAANSLRMLNNTVRTMNSSSTSQLNLQFDRLNTSLGNIDQNLQLLGGRGAGGGGGSLGTTILGFSALSIGMREIISHAITLADTVDTLGSRISTIADANIQGNQAGLFDGIFDAANSARIEVDAFSVIFKRFDTALKEFGISQQEALTSATGLAKALQLEGASASEAASALLQVSQALNKGKLDGDEFKSVSENTVLFIDELRKVLGGIDKGQLAALSEQGLITTEVMTQALRNLAVTASKVFDQSAVTVSQSFTILQNELVRSLSKGERVLEVLANSMLFLAHNADLLVLAIKAVGFALAALTLKATIASLFSLAHVITASVIPALISMTALVRAFIGLGWPLISLLVSSAFATIGAAISAALLPLTLITTAAVGLTLALKPLAEKLTMNLSAMKKWTKAGEEATRSISEQEVEAVRAAKAAGVYGLALSNVAENARKLNESNLRPAKVLPELQRKLNKAASEIGKDLGEISTDLELINLKLKVLQEPIKFNLKGTAKQFENLRSKLEEERLQIEADSESDPFARIRLATFQAIKKSILDVDKALENFNIQWIAINQAIASAKGNAEGFKFQIRELEKRELKFKIKVLKDKEALAELEKILTLERLSKFGEQALIKIRAQTEALNDELKSGSEFAGQIKNELEDLEIKELKLKIKLFDKESDKQLLTTIELLKELQSKGSDALESISRKQKSLNDLLKRGEISIEQFRIGMDRLLSTANTIRDLEFGDEAARRSNLSVLTYNETLEKIKDTGSDGIIKLNAEILATKDAFQQGLIKADAFKAKLDELKLEKLELKLRVNGDDESRTNLISFREELSFYEELRESGVDALTTLAAKERALARAIEDKIISQDQAFQQAEKLKEAYIKLNRELGFQTDIDLSSFESGFQSVFGRIQEGMQRLGTDIRVTMNELNNTLLNLGESGFRALSNGITEALLAGGNFIDNFKKLNSEGKIFNDVIKQIVNSLIQMAIRFLIAKAIQVAFGEERLSSAKQANKLSKQSAANILKSTALSKISMLALAKIAALTGSSITASMAPAATATTLATAGGNSVGAVKGIALTTAAMTKALASASTGGFRDGGFTGNMGRSRVAGLVHGQEFVVNAENTKRNRGLLEAINNGFDAQSTLKQNSPNFPQLNMSQVRVPAAPNSPNVGTGTKVEVMIENNVAGVEFDVRQDSDERIRIIARREADNAIQDTVPDFVAGELSNPNSSISSSLSANTTAERRRV